MPALDLEQQIQNFQSDLKAKATIDFYESQEMMAISNSSSSTPILEYFDRFRLSKHESFAQVPEEEIEKILGEFYIPKQADRDSLPLVMVGKAPELLIYRLPHLKGYQFWKANPSTFTKDEFPESKDITLISSTGSGKVSVAFLSR